MDPFPNVTNASTICSFKNRCTLTYTQVSFALEFHAQLAHLSSDYTWKVFNNQGGGHCSKKRLAFSLLSFFVAFKKAVWFKGLVWGKVLGALATDPPGQLDVLGHDGDPLGVDGAEVGVLKQADQVGLASLLQSHDSRALEPQVGLEVLSNLPHQALEGQLADEELGGLLVPPDLTEGHCARPVPVGLLDTTGGRGALPGGLGGQLLPGGLASGGLPGGLLGTSHVAGSEGTEPGPAAAGIFIAKFPDSAARGLFSWRAEKSAPNLDQ